MEYHQMTIDEYLEQIELERIESEKQQAAIVDSEEEEEDEKPRYWWQDDRF